MPGWRCARETAAEGEGREREEDGFWEGEKQEEEGEWV